VSLLTGISGLAAAAIALPVGPVIEHHRKRPVMITCDLVRFVAMGSVPVAAVLHALTYPQLVAVGVMTTAATIGFTSASDANLKALTDTATRTRVNSWFATSNYVSVTAGPPVGGLLISGLGATVTMAVDAVSYLGSVAGVWRIRTAEPAPAPRSAKSGVVDGWRYILAHQGLRTLFFNSMVFGGPVIMTSPLITVLILDMLKLPASAYGLALGVPCLGGIAGSRLAPVLTRKFGVHRVLVIFGVLRAPWMLLYPLATHKISGLVILMAADTALMVCAGIFNPVFATYRMNVTTDSYMARVVSAWGISSKTVQPVCVLIGGGLAAVIGVRPTILIAGLACTISAFLLPFRTLPAEELNLAEKTADDPVASASPDSTPAISE
jgi:MFS family permease